MANVDLSVQVPRELNDVRVALVELVKDLIAKKDLTTIAGENLANLAVAVAGLDQIPAEVKADKAAAAKCVGLLAGEIVAVLI